MNREIVLAEDGEGVGFNTLQEAVYFYNVATFFQKRNPNAELYQIQEFCQQHSNVEVETDADVIAEIIKVYGSVSEEELIDTVWHSIPDDYEELINSVLLSGNVISEMLNGKRVFTAIDKESLSKVTKN